jgi:hypothetical protein
VHCGISPAWRWPVCWRKKLRREHAQAAYWLFDAGSKVPYGATLLTCAVGKVFRLPLRAGALSLVLYGEKDGHSFRALATVLAASCRARLRTMNFSYYDRTLPRAGDRHF